MAKHEMFEKGIVSFARGIAIAGRAEVEICEQRGEQCSGEEIMASIMTVLDEETKEILALDEDDFAQTVAWEQVKSGIMAAMTRQILELQNDEQEDDTIINLSEYKSKLS